MGPCHKWTNKVSGSLHEGFENLDDAIQFMLDNTSLSRESIKVFDGRGTELVDYINDNDIEGAVGGVDRERAVSDINTTIIDPVLTFVVFALDNSPIGHVTNTLVQFYTSEELTCAKDKLWDVSDTEVIGEYTKRRDGATRSVQEILASDITGAIQKLDIAGSVPNVVIDPIGLNRIPKIIPSETNVISMCERITAVENRVKELEHSVGENVCKSAVVAEKLNKLTNYSSIVARPTPSAPPHHEIEVASPISRMSNMPIVTTMATSGSSSVLNSVTQPVSRIAGFGSSQRDTLHPDRVGESALSGAAATPLQRSASQLSVRSHTSQASASFEFQRGARKKQRRRENAVVGTGTSDHLRGAPAPNRDIFVFRVEYGDADGMKKYMTKRDINVCNIDQTSNDDARFKSYKVTVKVSDLSKVLMPDFWPKGVHVRRWYKPRAVENNHDG